MISQGPSLGQTYVVETCSDANDGRSPAGRNGKTQIPIRRATRRFYTGDLCCNRSKGYQRILRHTISSCLKSVIVRREVFCRLENRSASLPGTMMGTRDGLSSGIKQMGLTIMKQF